MSPSPSPNAPLEASARLTAAAVANFRTYLNPAQSLSQKSQQRVCYQTLDIKRLTILPLSVYNYRTKMQVDERYK